MKTSYMQTQTSPFKEKERIAHILMLNSFFLSEIGLFQGQIGIALVMAQFYKYTNNEIFSDFVYDLLEIIISKTDKRLPFHFSNGLSGIGWGIEYLIQNKLVEGESVEVLEELDLKIMETNVKRITDFSLETGFEGLLLYVIYHLQGAIKQDSKLPFDRAYLSDIYSICKRIEYKKANKSLQSLLNIYIASAENKAIPDYNPQIMSFATNLPEIDYNKLATYSLGLNNGLAGALIHLIEKDKK